MMDTYETISLEKIKGIAVIALNLSNILEILKDRIQSELLSALKHCENDEEIKVVVLKGSGRVIPPAESLNTDYLLSEIFSREGGWNLREAVARFPKTFVPL